MIICAGLLLEQTELWWEIERRKTERDLIEVSLEWKKEGENSLYSCTVQVKLRAGAKRSCKAQKSCALVLLHDVLDTYASPNCLYVCLDIDVIDIQRNASPLWFEGILLQHKSIDKTVQCLPEVSLLSQRFGGGFPNISVSYPCDKRGLRCIFMVASCLLISHWFMTGHRYCLIHRHFTIKLIFWVS